MQAILRLLKIGGVTLVLGYLALASKDIFDADGVFAAMGQIALGSKPGVAAAAGR